MTFKRRLDRLEQQAEEAQAQRAKLAELPPRLTPEEIIRRGRERLALYFPDRYKALTGDPAAEPRP